MRIRIKDEFKDDAVTREAGEKLRKRIAAGLKVGQKIELDFSGCMIASTSFFDEGIAKLPEEGLSPEQIAGSLSIIHLFPRDRELLDDLCKRRGGG